MPAAVSGWWSGSGPGAPPRSASAPRLSIVQPDPDTHVWRNPEAPPADEPPRAAGGPPSRRSHRSSWLVDGKPVATAPPDAPLFWTMTPGHHRFQVRLPLESGASRPIAVVIE